MKVIRHVLILWIALLPLRAQTTVTYTNGETDTSALSTTAPNNPTTLSIATGTATQSGLISGTGAVDLSGGGILILSNASNSYTGATTVSSGTTLAISASGNIADSSALSLSASGATFDISSNTNVNGVSVATLSGVAGSVVQLGSQTLAVEENSSATFAGVMEGTGSSNLTLAGSGHLTLTGVNTYQGVTEISSGSTLSMGTGGSIADSSELEILGTGTFSIINGGNQTIGDLFGASASILSLGTNTLTTGATASTTYAGTITSTSSAGSLIKQGTGTLTLTGTNTYYIGTTTIANGTLQVAGGAIFDCNAVSLSASGATLVNSSTSQPMTITDLSGVAGSVVQFGSQGLTVSMDKSTTFAGVMEGTSGSSSNFTVQGNSPDNGHLTLTGVNTYPGTTTIGSGTILSIGAGGSIADSNFVTLNGTANFDIMHAGNQTIGELAGSSGSTLSLGGNTLTTGNAGSSSYLGTITSNSSTGSLIKQGAGTLTLSGNNIYQGATTINGGLLIIFGGNISNSSGVNLANSGTVFAIAQYSQTISNLTGVSGSTVELYEGILTVGTAASTEFDGVIEGSGGEGAGGLNKQGTGILTLTGNNTYTGGTTISSGRLQIGNGGTSGNLGSGGVTDNASLGYDLSGNLTESNTIIGTGSLVQTGTGTLTLTGTNTYSGGTTVSAGTLAFATGGTLGTGGTLAVNTGGTLSLGGNQTVGAVTVGGGTIGGTGTLTGTSYNSTAGGTISAILAGSGSFTNTSGTTTLSGANTYSGGTNISAGTLQIGSGGTSGNLGTGGVTDNGSLVYDRTNSLTDGNVISGTGSITQSGTGGTTILTAANTYSGATTVSAGELIITGNLTSSSSLSVASGATLDLTGATVSTPGAITNNGTLVLGAGVTLSSTGTFTNNGTLNLLNDPTYTLPANFVNNGTVLTLTLSPTDTPTMPPWALTFMAMLLFFAAAPVLAAGKRA